MPRHSVNSGLWVAVLCVAMEIAPSTACGQQLPSAPLQSSSLSSAKTSQGGGSNSLATQPSTASSLADLFISQTKIQLLSHTISGNAITNHYSLAFPTHTTGDLILTFQINATYTPTAADLHSSGTSSQIYGYSSASSRTSNGQATTVTIKYFVPYSSLPAATVKQLQGLVVSVPTSSQSKFQPQLLDAAYSYYAQQGEGSPLESNGGQSIPGVSFSGSLNAADTAAQSVETFCEASGWGNCLPEGTGELTAWAKNAADIPTLAEEIEQEMNLWQTLLEYRYCAGDPNVQNPQTPRPTTSADASKADDILDGVRGSFADQFLFKLAEAAPSEKLLEPLLSPALESVQDKLKSDLNDALQRMQALLPYCKGMWYGAYRITENSPDGNESIVDSGMVRFFAAGNMIATVIRGSAVGHYQYHRTGESGCTKLLSERADLDYNAALMGGANMFQSFSANPQSPQSATIPANSNTAIIGTASVSPPTYQKIGNWDNCGDRETTRSDPQSYPGWKFNFMLMDGQTTTDPYPIPDPRATPPPSGLSGQVNITVHKLP